MTSRGAQSFISTTSSSAQSLIMLAAQRALMDLHLPPSLAGSRTAMEVQFEMSLLRPFSLTHSTFGMQVLLSRTQLVLMQLA